MQCHPEESMAKPPPKYPEKKPSAPGPDDQPVQKYEPPTGGGAREPALTTQAALRPTPEQQAIIDDQRARDEKLEGINSVVRGEPMSELAARIDTADQLVHEGKVKTPEEYLAIIDPAAEEKRGPTAEEAEAVLLRDMISALKPYQDEDESTLDTLRRLLVQFDNMQNDRLDIGDVNHVLTFDAKLPPTGARSEGARVRQLVAKVQEYEQQLQPAHNAFGPKAHARGVLVSHVEGSGPKYDVGGKYRLALVTVNNGRVTIAEAADVVAGVTSHDMPFGLVRDHLEKRVEDFLTPEAHRS